MNKIYHGFIVGSILFLYDEYMLFIKNLEWFKINAAAHGSYFIPEDVIKDVKEYRAYFENI